MENGSRTSPDFVLIGLVEMENVKYLYSVLALVLYITNVMLSSAIICVIWMEAKLHEPMYVFIANLVFNAIIGSSTIFPKMMADLLLGFKTIDLSRCLVQSLFIECVAYTEIITFTIMAYDMYLAIGHPLRYSTLMTNEKALKSVSVTWVIVFIHRIIGVTLTARLSLCGAVINSVYCETMSLTHLACGDTTINNVFGTTSTVTVMVASLLIVTYCYVRTLVFCLKISASSSQKAIHTLVMHIAAFSTFMAASLFVGFRYRLNIGPQSSTTHVIISMTGITVSITLNPLIYGLRTEALRVRILASLRIANFGKILSKTK
ncbi:olfactory receptor 4B13-like [Leptodactylus fuscus]|uniref:olfactory receptor 4B13-like n=1 Tax=Leptodactylus fuscus TaxID=238119 RepID=UPI003F4E858D